MNQRLVSDRISASARVLSDLVWQTCEAFHGEVEPVEYKDYILTMFFFKYVSDGAKAASQGQAPAGESYAVPPGCDFETVLNQRSQEEISSILNAALHAIEEANPTRLHGVFRSIDFTDPTVVGLGAGQKRRLRTMLELFADEDLNLSPAMGDNPHPGEREAVAGAFSILLDRFAAAAEKKANTFYTPGDVCRLMARLVGPGAGETICDPAGGSGALLVETALQAMDVGNSTQKAVSIFGQERDRVNWALCRMHLLLHGMDTARIEHGDTLRQPLLVDHGSLMEFDIVVSHPTFSLKDWGEQEAEREAAGETGTTLQQTAAYRDVFNRFARGVPPRNRGDYAFILHIVETIRPDSGRAAVVMPQGVLFRGGKEGAIRQALIEENLIEAVIAMPDYLFYGTAVPTAILLFRKKRSTQDVLIIDASQEFGRDNRNVRLRESDIEKIVSSVHNHQQVAGYAHLASPEEIASNDFDLSITRYIRTEYVEEADIVALHHESEQLEAELAHIRSQIKERLSQWGLK